MIHQHQFNDVTLCDLSIKHRKDYDVTMLIQEIKHLQKELYLANLQIGEMKTQVQEMRDRCGPLCDCN